MPRLAGPLAAAAVAALAAAAALDAVRREEPPPSPAAQARAAGLSGALVWSDAGCRRHELRLPSLARRDFRTQGCGVFSRGDSLGIGAGEVAWFAFPGAGGSTVVLSRAAIAREVGAGHRPVSTAWLGRLRHAVVLRGPRPVVGLFQGDRAIRLDPLGPESARVRASPRGSFYAVLAGDGTLVVRDRDGRRVDLPGEAGAVAWSPDERFAALAGERAVAVVPARGGEELARFPVVAVDIDWRR